jgi:RsiW-degrading membrane proteinase PrsW (M82 family)
MVSTIAILVATIIPMLCAYGMYTLDLYQTRSRWYILYCFLWGMIAYKLAAWLNIAMFERGIVSMDNMLRFSAPVLEEILKGSLLLYLVRKADFTYFVDGAIYGFAIGIGFAIVENYEYVLGNLGTALATALARVFSTNLIHAAGSGTIGISLGIARLTHSQQRLRLIISGLLLAIGLHIGFNNLVTRVDSGLQVILAVVVGLSAAAFIFLSIKRGLKDEKRWIEQSLGMQDRVTPHESSVVNCLQDLQRILSPLAERFGPQKVEAIEQFLLIQARLGILRKTLEVFRNQDDEKMVKAVQAQMDDLREKMDQIRRSVGAYCMLYLRTIFPEETSPVWKRLEDILKERATSASKPDGVNLWSSLDRRILLSREETD